MAKQLPSVDTNADTFYSWIIKTNGLVQLCNTEVVTANNSANGAVTTGTGFVIGTFGANNLVATTIRGGNTISNSAVSVVSNTMFTADTNRFDNGVTLGAASSVLSNGLKTSFANTQADQLADSFSSTAYRTAKYVISVAGSGTNYQSTEILVLNNGVTTFTTEYATISSNTQLCTFRTDVANNNVRLLVTPVVSGLQVTIARTLVAV